MHNSQLDIFLLRNILRQLTHQPNQIRKPEQQIVRTCDLEYLFDHRFSKYLPHRQNEHDLHYSNPHPVRDERYIDNECITVVDILRV
jgi:hypothetical protein